jgi:hypothetical protein
MLVGWVAFVVLTCLACFASIAVAVRTAASGRAELGVAATLVLIALIATPAMALGFAQILWPASLALVSLVVFAGAFFASAYGRGWRAHARDTIRATRSLVLLPIDALRVAWKERSVALVGLVAAAFLIVFATWTTWVAPTESWDGYFYHDPIVGFSIQDHGFRMVPLPRALTVQQTNGFPRLCEMLSLWCVIFTDRTLMELPNTLAAGPLILASYVLIRRYVDRVAAMGLATVVLLTPAAWTQLRTTYVDLVLGIIIIGAIHFGTRPVYRIRDGIMMTLAVAMFGASKFTALPWIPLVGTLFWARLLVHHFKTRRRDALVVILVGGLLVAAVTSIQLIRNWRAFGNPVWPVTYDNAKWGIHWPGLANIETDFLHPSVPDLIKMHFGPPERGFGDFQRRDYGYGLPWVILPLAALGTLWAAFRALRELRDRNPGVACNVLLVAIAGLLSLAVTPSLVPGRYNFHLCVAIMAVAGWLVSGGRVNRSNRLAEGIVAATLALTVLPDVWPDWLFAMSQTRVRELARRPAVEREWMYAEPWNLKESVARMREREIGRKDRVAFTQEIYTPAPLWNSRFSNEIAFIEYKDANDFYGKLASYGPKWICVGGGSAARQALQARPNEWEELGHATSIDDGMLYRRKAR